MQLVLRVSRLICIFNIVIMSMKSAPNKKQVAPKELVTGYSDLIWKVKCGFSDEVTLIWFMKDE